MMLRALLSFLLFFPVVLHAQTDPSAIQAQIDQSSAQIAQLEAEIAQLQKQLTSTSKQKQTLQSAVTSLNLNIQKITKSITLTDAQIVQKDTEIQRLSGSISTTASDIDRVTLQIEDSLRQLTILDQEPLALILLQGGTLSDFFNQSTDLASLRTGLEQKVADLANLKTTLTTSKTAAQQKRAELAKLQQNLSQQKQSLAIARDSQTQLLKETKNKESNYQALIAEKKAQQEKFEQDLLNYQAKLNLKFNPNTLPKTGTGALQWPIGQSFIVTQYFGTTPFSTANPQVYNGHGHSGIDLSASPGTPILAARSGIILGTGNTDLTCPNASFGKWVFIKHDNGLSTIYAHLSVISVSEGQQVTTGQVIGYSGSTGYATGPHLHFGVYASSGSEIASFPSKSCRGKVFTMPVGDLSAYLNPLSYLPPLP